MEVLAEETPVVTRKTAANLAENGNGVSTENSDAGSQPATMDLQPESAHLEQTMPQNEDHSIDDQKMSAVPSGNNTAANSSSLHTPARNHSFSSLSSLMSPTKLTRLEERHELQTLNNRLEHYMMLVRNANAERDALEAQLEEERKRFQQELNDATDDFEHQMEKARRARDHQANQRAQLETQNARQEKQLHELEGKLKQRQEERDQARERCQQAEEELQRRNNEVRNLMEDLDKATQSLEEAQNQAEGTEEELQELTEQNERQQARISQLETRIESLTNDLTYNNRRADEERRKLQSQIDRQNQEHRDDVDQLRQEYNQHLRDKLEERQKQNEEEKQSLLDEIRKLHEDYLAKDRNAARALEAENQALRAQRDQLTQQLQDANDNLDDLQAEVDRLQDRIAELQRQLAIERKRPNEELERRNQTIRDLEKELKDREAEFLDLMDVKVALTQEIRAYRDLLDGEERRLGIATPSSTPFSPALSERSVSRPSSSSSPSSSSVPSSMDRVLPPSLNASAPATNQGKRRKKRQRQEVAIHDGEMRGLTGDFVIITNNSSEPMEMRGWQLKSRRGQQSYDFVEDLCLQPDAYVTIWSGANNSENHNPPTDYLWTTDWVWNTEGDEAVLVNPSGQEVSSAIVLPIDDPEVIQARQNNCSIM